MKNRIRSYELTLITLIAGTLIARYLWEAFTISNGDSNESYQQVFKAHGLSFHYFTNVLSPRISSIIFSYLLYLSLHLLSIPQLLITRNKNYIQYLWLAAYILIVTFLLALNANVATYFAHPYLFSYNGYRFLALFGYNDAPLTDIFFGFNRAFVFISIYLIFACLREYLILLIQKSAKKEYRILVANQIALSIVVYLIIPFFTLVFIGGENEIFFIIYFSIITPALFVSLTNIFLIFPLSDSKPLLNIRTIVLIVAFSLFYTFLCLLIFRRFAPLPLFITSWLAQLLMVSPISWLVYSIQKDKLLQLRGAEKALVKSKADLQFLRSQINPHFLFNALNTLYGTALIDGSKKTAEGIQKLGDMMRFMLHDNHQDFIPMSSEINYLKNYISLQKLRIQTGPGITIEENIAEQGCNHVIAPMLLIPFVENAFKHGIHAHEPSWIKIKLTCDENNIRFEVSNSIHTATENDPEKDHSGIGLGNVRERLHLFYENRHQLQIESDRKEFKAVLIINPNQ